MRSFRRVVYGALLFVCLASFASAQIIVSPQGPPPPTGDPATFLAGDWVYRTPSGDVIRSGTPSAGQAAIWTSATAIEGLSTLPAAVQDLITRTGTLVSGATGAGFTLALSASTVTGTLADVRLSSNVALKNAIGTWTATQSMAQISITAGSRIASAALNSTTTLASNMSTGAIAGITFDNFGVALTGTSGAQRGIEATMGFAPTSGTATFSQISLVPTINQTGGASGITRGLYVNPTLTAAADFRAIEVALGPVILTPLASASGVRYLCVNTTGVIVSQAAACVGT